MKSIVLRRIPILRPRGLPDPSSPHETRANSILRPIVFGGNDGLVSNLALVMGVAGANPEPGVIVLAGIAGLIAGAFSMGVGEYISVQSQRELLDYQLAFQRHQLAHVPDRERRILAENPLYSAVRQLLLGAVAAVVTYGVGALIGVRA